MDILALPDNGLLHYGQFHVSLAAGLEDSIISVIAPPWNHGTTSSDAAPFVLDPQGSEPPMLATTELPRYVDTGSCDPGRVLQDAAVSQSPRPIASFPLVVRKTYYKQGFFNVGVSYEDLFGSDSQEIEVFCGLAEQPIIGTINRSANNNRTPRIMGGKGLRDWFHRNMREMQEAIVTVLSPTAIRIEPREGTNG